MTTEAPPAPVAGNERIERFKEQAGESTGEMPPKKPPAAHGPEFDPEIVVKGSSEQLSFDVGGKPPTVSKLKVQGKAVEVRGQFKKGQLLEIRATVRLDGIAHDDKRDSSTDEVIDCIRTHKAKIVALTIAED